MRADADVLVIGGGPVGLATAIEARLAGLTVGIVEPRTRPIDKACGEGLMPGAVAGLERLGVHGGGAEFRGIAYVQGAVRAEHRFRAGPGRGIRRTVLQATLAERARELGVRWHDGRVERLDQDAGGVTTTGAGIGTLRADWLIGCDGLHSTVRRLVGLQARAQRPSTRRFGMRRHYAIAPFSDVVEVHWTPEIEAYVTPLGPELVGVALLGPRGPGFDDAIARVPGLADRLVDAAPVGDVRGAGPLLQRTTSRVAGRVLLAGDASGYVDALTGEGLRVGFAQARAAIASIAAADPHSYEGQWLSATRDFRHLTAGLVAAARSPLRGRVVPAAARAPRLFGAIVERLAR